MQSAFIVKDKNNKPYAVIVLLAGGTEFHPIAESAKNWSTWMRDEYATQKISKQELTVTLDNSMTVEGPLVANRTNKTRIDDLIRQAKKTQDENLQDNEQKSVVLLPVVSIMDIAIGELEDCEWRNGVNFKAQSFLSDINKSTFSYEVKRTRAVWDASLSVPGTERRGGWRCPVGTRYGGQITDRFGRNCGWGVARRLANEISDLGERLENVGDRRRERRVARRNERMVRRLQQGGAIERGARAVANALETGTPPATGQRRERQAGLVERVAGRVAGALETPTPRRNRRGGTAPQREPRRAGLLERGAGGLARMLETDETPTRPARPQQRRPRPAAPQARPARPRQPRNANRYSGMSESELRREWDNNAPYLPGEGRIGMNPSIEQDKAKRRRDIEDEMRKRGMNIPDGAAPRLNLPTGEGQRAPRAPRPQRPQAVPQNLTPAGAPRAGESLQDYKDRKYGEFQQNVRQIRERGGRAGFLRRNEWEQFHGPAVEEAWNRAQGRGGRSARRTAATAGAQRAATRRPTAQDIPEPRQPAQRRRVPFRAENVRGFSSRRSADRRRAQLRQDQPNERFRIAQFNDKFYVVKQSELDRLDADARRGLLVFPDPPPRPARPATPAAPSARGANQYDSAFRDNGWKKVNDKWTKGNWEITVQQDENGGFNKLVATNPATGQIFEQDKASGVSASQHLEGFENILRYNDDRGFDSPASRRTTPAAPSAPRPATPAAPPTPPSSGSGRTGTRNKRRPLANLVKGKKNDAKLGNIGRDGLPDAQRIEIGNAGINTKEDAVRHLSNNGDLKDVPDEFLHDALKENAGPGKRFTVRSIGGGVNGSMPVYKDSRTGKEYFVKYLDRRAYAHNEDLNEIIGNNIAARLGFPVGEFRFAGPAYTDARGQGRPIIFEHVDNYIDGSSVAPSGKMKNDDVIAATIFDYLILNTDRHRGNYMMVIQNGERRFVPIDPSLGFNARVFNGDMADAAGFRYWVNNPIGGGRNSMLSKLRADIRSGALSREDALRMVARLQEQLRGSERERPYLDFAQKAVEAAGAIGGNARENISPQTTAANARIQWLISQSPENILREIAG